MASWLRVGLCVQEDGEKKLVFHNKAYALIMVVEYTTIYMFLKFINYIANNVHFTV